MDFYIRWFWKTCHLTMESAFVKSGILWGPFPFAAAAVEIVILFLLSLAFFGRKGTHQPFSLTQVSKALLSTTLVTMAGLFVVFWYEGILYAPDAVVNDAEVDAKKAQSDADRKQWTHDTQQLRDALKTANDALEKHAQNVAKAYIGFENTKLSTTKSGVTVFLNAHNYGSVSAEDIKGFATGVFGSGAKTEMMTAALVTPGRLLPGQNHQLQLEVNKRTSKNVAMSLALVREQAPITVTIVLYFSTNDERFSQQTILFYRWDERRWAMKSEKIVGGFVSMPAASVNGRDVYFNAPWLPPIPSSVPNEGTIDLVPPY